MLKGLLYFYLNFFGENSVWHIKLSLFVFASFKKALDIYKYITCITKHMHIYV